MKKNTPVLRGKLIIKEKSDNPQKAKSKKKPNYRLIDRDLAECLNCHIKLSLRGMSKHLCGGYGFVPLQAPEVRIPAKKQKTAVKAPVAPAATNALPVPEKKQDMVLCPKCQGPVGAKNLETHLRERCPKNKDFSVISEPESHPNRQSVKPLAEIVTKSRFSVSLNLYEGVKNDYLNAARAVHYEYSSSIKWKQLRCVNVTQSAELGEAIFKMEIGLNVDLGWGWEGGLAFKAAERDTLNDLSELERLSESAKNSCDDREGLIWAGEVIEVDNENGFIYVFVGNLSKKPSTGVFYIKPFEFLRYLDLIYNKNEFSFLAESLTQRLGACAGKIKNVQGKCNSTYSIPQLKTMWQKDWCILWGPPGTGKTTTVGRQIASVFEDPEERILIVSTTNKATDEVALRIGEFLSKRYFNILSEGIVLRIGKGAAYKDFKEKNLLGLLKGTETELLKQIEALQEKLHLCRNSDERAVIQQELKEIKAAMSNRAIEHFVSPKAKVIVATAFKALELLSSSQVKEFLRSAASPFSTIVIDEAGLISRAAGAVLSMLGAKRVVWVGDPLQLAPISKSACAIAPELSKWLTRSCLSHLQSPKTTTDNLVLLNEQHRMHPDISRVISGFQYENSLKNSPAVFSRQFKEPKLFHGIPRAVWHVLDEENDSQISHIRGAGDKSWRRPITEKILQRFFLEPSLKELSGIFVTPFKAQAIEIAAFFKQMSLTKWKAATIHSFQGTEADIVILDTVFAGSRAWDSSEWKRLINVGISRGKHFALVIASRAEMSHPFIKPLVSLLNPMFLRKTGMSAEFVPIKPKLKWNEENENFINPDCLGAKIARLKSLRPVLSGEQQRLCNSDPDGKPRLVRGVAGSGKTYVLANWLVKALKRLESKPDACVFVVYGNHSLQPLLEENVAQAWFDQYPDVPFPRKMIDYRHIKHLLEALFSSTRLKYNFDFEYDSASLAFLNRMADKVINPICDAIFLDEAQDMGPNTLKLLFNLVKRSDPADKNSRAIHIFYDNAQNLYDRETPKWSDLGISLTGRSKIMKESFRSTQPISEYALNCLYRFQPPDSDHDYKELLKLKLVEPVIKSKQQWWKVNFNQNDGYLPEVRQFESEDEQINKIGSRLENLIRDEKVTPGDICIIALEKFDCSRIEKELKNRIKSLGADISFQSGERLCRDRGTVLISTAHSFKGYDAEIVMVAFANKFCKRPKNSIGERTPMVKSAALYVAMTRARSILEIYCYKPKTEIESQLINVLSTSRCFLEHNDDVEQLDPSSSFSTSSKDNSNVMRSNNSATASTKQERYVVKPLISHSEVIDTATGESIKTFYDVGAKEKAQKYAANKNSGKQ